MRRSLVTILALAGTVGLAVATATAAPHTNRLTAAARPSVITFGQATTVSGKLTATNHSGIAVLLARVCDEPRPGGTPGTPARRADTLRSPPVRSLEDRMLARLAPTVLAPVSNDDRAAREEIFGPVACVIPFADEAEAVALANDTIYGLSGSVWTRDGAKALRVARAVETGVMSINSNTSVRVSTPFGGFKQSGVGRELGPHALEHYSELKTVYYATGGA